MSSGIGPDRPVPGREERAPAMFRLFGVGVALVLVSFVLALASLPAALLTAGVGLVLLLLPFLIPLAGLLLYAAARARETGGG